MMADIRLCHCVRQKKESDLTKIIDRCSAESRLWRKLGRHCTPARSCDTFVITVDARVMDFFLSTFFLQCVRKLDYNLTLVTDWIYSSNVQYLDLEFSLKWILKKLKLRGPKVVEHRQLARKLIVCVLAKREKRSIPSQSVIYYAHIKRERDRDTSAVC
jgi:hypothetical protein